MLLLRLLIITVVLLGTAGTSNLVFAAPASSESSDAGASDAHVHDPLALDPIAIDPDIALFTLVVFAILFFATSKFAWGPIAERLEQRDRVISDGLAAAKQSQAQADRLVAQYQQQMAQASEQVRTLLEETRREAEHLKNETVAQAKAAATAQRDAGLQQIEAAKVAAIGELSSRSTVAAIEFARKFVGDSINSSEQQQLIQQTAEEIAAEFAAKQA